MQPTTSVRIQHPGGSITSCTVTTKDLSASGICFRYGNYLHVGTLVVITLRRRRGGEEQVLGEVVRCSYVSASWHDIGVKFRQPIFPQLFADPAEWESLSDTPMVDPSTLSGSVLLVDDQEMDRELFHHLLRQTQVKLKSYANIEAAANAVKESLFNVACLDVNLGSGRTGGVEAGQLLRAAGYRGQIIVTSIESTSRAEVARQLGTALSLQKPFDRNQLFYVLAMAMQVRAEEKLSPIYAELEDRTDCQTMLERYVGQVQRAAMEIQRFIEQNNFDAVRLQCQTLRGTGTGYGFRALSDAAAKAVTALDAGCVISEAEAELQVLQSICRRLSADDPKATAGNKIARE